MPSYKTRIEIWNYKRAVFQIAKDQNTQKDSAKKSKKKPRKKVQKKLKKKYKNKTQKKNISVFPLFFEQASGQAIENLYKTYFTGTKKTPKPKGKAGKPALDLEDFLEALQSLAQEEGFSASFGQRLYLPDWQGSRLLFCGLGRADKNEAYRMESALALGLSSLPLKQGGNILLFVPYHKELSLFTRMLACISALHRATYRAKESLAKPPEVRRLRLVFSKKDRRNVSPKKLLQMKERAEQMALARGFAKDLVNTPPNLKSARSLAQEARRLEGPGLQVKITDDISWIQKKMPAFYAVARGSLKSDPPHWIRISYRPKGKIYKKIALVGKSVLYDTGGYQVKPGNGMLTMKADMTGGASVLAVFRALANLQPRGISVDGYLAATPNMIDADAFVADSILKSACGKKIEVRHTDAEGRLTLIDAVHFAAKTRPDLILTVATLTGAATRAVGMRAAVMANHKAWRRRFTKAARRACDPFETLEVLAEDYEAIQSQLDGAKLKNTGDSWGRGAQSAAAFVFSGAPSKQSIVHLDIAGGDMTRDDKATGIAVQALLQFLLDLSR